MVPFRISLPKRRRVVGRLRRGVCGKVRQIERFLDPEKFPLKSVHLASWCRAALCTLLEAISGTKSGNWSSKLSGSSHWIALDCSLHFFFGAHVTARAWQSFVRCGFRCQESWKSCYFRQQKFAPLLCAFNAFVWLKSFASSSFSFSFFDFKVWPAN